MTHTAGVIGVGRVGRNHAEAFLEAENVRLESIADLDERSVADLGERWSIPESKRYRHHSSLLGSENPDVISVATPARFHYDHVLDVVRSSNPPDVVWCEKPIATRLRHADEMVAACDAAGIELVVNHSRRFATAYESLRELLHGDDLLGDLNSFHLLSGGRLLNTGTHYVDLVRYLLGDRVDGVHGGYVDLVGADDDRRFTGGGTLETATGTVAAIDLTAGRAASDRAYVAGTEGMLSIPLSVGQEADTAWRYWRVEDGSRTPAPAPVPLEEQWRTDISGTHSTYRPGMVPAQTLFDSAAEHVAGLLDGQTQNRSPGTEAVRGLEVLTGIVLSDYAGTRIALPLEAPVREIPLALEGFD